MEKIKLQDVFAEVLSEAMFEAIKKAKPSIQAEDMKGLESQFDWMTENQFKHFMDKTFPEKLNEKALASIQDKLIEGNGIELPKTCLVFPSESTVRKTEGGEPHRKLSIRTRSQMKKDLN